MDLIKDIIDETFASFKRVAEKLKCPKLTVLDAFIVAPSFFSKNWLEEIRDGYCLLPNDQIKNDGSRFTKEICYS